MKKAFKLAKSHGDFKGLNYAIMKATSYKHKLPKEKHIRTIFQSLSPSKPRSEVVYCIQSIVRRVNQTNNWAIALKSLIILHRAMRELDYTVWGELVNCGRVRGYLIDLSHFHDGSIPNGLDYSAWIRNYGHYLEERLRCFVVVNHDVATYSSKYSQRLDTKDLLEQLPALQCLLFRLLDCKPAGAASYNRLIQYALSTVAGESVKLYVAITVRVVDLLDKFFEMNHDDAISALHIYKKSGSQAERLSQFFETCRSLEFGKGQKFINIKQPPSSFITTMEEYIKETPLMLEYNVNAEEKETPNENGVDDLLTTDEDNSNPSKTKGETTEPPQAADLMGLYDLLTGASEFDENSLALTVIPTDNSNNDENGACPVTGWEVALFTDGEVSNDNAVALYTESEGSNDKIVAEGGDSLFAEAIIDGTQQDVAYHIDPVNSNPFDFPAGDDEEYNMAVAFAMANQNIQCVPHNMGFPPQMLGMPYQDYYITQQHQQQQQEPQFIMTKKTTNPFDVDEPNVLPPA